MKEIFEQYGGAIITVIVITALVAIVMLLMKTDGAVAVAFKDMISQLTKSLSDTVTTVTAQNPVTPA